MPLDALTLSALRQELEGTVKDMKIDKIQQPEQDQILLSLRGYGPASKLLLSAGTGDARAHLTASSFENPANPPMFCMLLRKHLLGARIRGIAQPPLERALDFTLDCVDAVGTPCEKHLILELVGRYANIILTGEDGRIIECLRRVDTSQSELRQVLPGLFYRPIPMTVQGKHDPLATDATSLKQLLKSAPAEMAADKWLLETFLGLSPLLCREIVWRACGDTGARIETIISKDGGEKLSSAFISVTGDIASGKTAPYLLTDATGKPVDFSCVPIMQYGTALELAQYGSFSALLDTFYTRRFTLERLRQRTQSLQKTVRNAHDRVKRKLENQREEFKKTQNRERYRELGDLITANLHLAKKGMSVLRVADYYAEDGRETDIPLDTLKTPQQNAAKYYKDYTKARNAEAVLSEQIRLGEEELEYLKSVLEELSRAESEKDVGEIRRELAATGYIREQTKSKGKKEKIPEAAPMRFISGTGFDILVGRNNVQNDALTNRLAFKSDVWLHTQKIPGSHVIISTKGQEPDAETLQEAASLAAWFSQARESKKVPVDYTLVKYVKKIPGGRPGMVTYTEQQTIIAEPDEALVKRLGK
jgi:predicted ribosome quality control (RQC) complex YloA/Tae2 family protein